MKMLTPVLKFSEIKKNPNIMTGLEQAAVVRYGDVVAYVVSPERMNELLAAEEQHENGYMAQKDISVKLNYDIAEIPDVDSIKRALAGGTGCRGHDIKVGDTVRIRSLDKTDEDFGVVGGMFSVGELHIVTLVNGVEVELGYTNASYHIDDLELVK